MKATYYRKIGSSTTHDPPQPRPDRSDHRASDDRRGGQRQRPQHHRQSREQRDHEGQNHEHDHSQDRRVAPHQEFAGERPLASGPSSLVAPPHVVGRTAHCAEDQVTSTHTCRDGVRQEGPIFLAPASPFATGGRPTPRVAPQEGNRHGKRPTGHDGASRVRAGAGASILREVTKALAAWPVTRYRRRRGRPSTDASISSQRLLSRPSRSRRASAL